MQYWGLNSGLFALAKQALYHLSHAINLLFVFVIFVEPQVLF
jgi:hypothetical protein